MSAPENPPLMSIMNSPLLRQQQERPRSRLPSRPFPHYPFGSERPAAVVSPAVAVDASAAGAVGMAPYGFDPAGPTPPLVPVRGADAAAVPVSAVFRRWHQLVYRWVLRLLLVRVGLLRVSR